MTLVFKSGTVDRPPLLTCGYSGTGLQCLRIFLREAGLDGGALTGIDEAEWRSVSVP